MVKTKKYPPAAAATTKAANRFPYKKPIELCAPIPYQDLTAEFVRETVYLESKPQIVELRDNRSAVLARPDTQIICMLCGDINNGELVHYRVSSHYNHRKEHKDVSNLPDDEMVALIKSHEPKIDLTEEPDDDDDDYPLGETDMIAEIYKNAKIHNRKNATPTIELPLRLAVKLGKLVCGAEVEDAVDLNRKPAARKNPPPTASKRSSPRKSPTENADEQGTGTKRPRKITKKAQAVLDARAAKDAAKAEAKARDGSTTDEDSDP